MSALPQPDDEWADPADGDDLARLMDRHDDEGVGAFGLADGLPHCFCQVAVVSIGNQMGEDLGVGLRCELVSIRNELLA